jgi:hypothetical protein
MKLVQEKTKGKGNRMFLNMTLPSGGLQPALPVLAADRVKGALQRHLEAMRAVQDSMMRYQWHATAHGWGSLLAHQHREMEAWMERLAMHLEEAGMGVSIPPSAKPRVGDDTNLPADGLALAARMMTDFEALEHQLGEIWVMAEDVASAWMYDVLMGLGFMYHKAAGLYRQHLCASVVAAWEKGEAGLDSDNV